jgi:uncharacterized cupredoxin-like copper-binding protein
VSASPSAGVAASPAASPAVKPAASPSVAASVVPSPSAAAAAGNTVSFDAAEYSYTLPDSIPAGPVTLVMRNTGKEAHHAQFVKLNTGVTFQQFTAALQQGEGPALALVSFQGGTGALDPGSNTESVSVNLQPGDYVVLCFLTGADGVPHFAKGMIKPLTVTAATTPAAATKPNTTVTITLKDFTFDSPDTLSGGTWAITNAGPQPHELQVAKLASGGSANDVLNFFATPTPSGPPTFQSVGGFQGVDPNLSGTLSLNLTPGQYAFYCAIPDPTNGKRHLQEGMLKQVTIN